nr:hypothetical protein [Tanacetum cinerariifolium]
MKIQDIIEKRIEKAGQHINKEKQIMHINKGKKKMVMERGKCSFEDIALTQAMINIPAQTTSDEGSYHNSFQATFDESSDHNPFQVTSNESSNDTLKLSSEDTCSSDCTWKQKKLLKRLYLPVDEGSYHNSFQATFDESFDHNPFQVTSNKSSNDTLKSSSEDTCSSDCTWKQKKLLKVKSGITLTLAPKSTRALSKQTLLIKEVVIKRLGKEIIVCLDSYMSVRFCPVDMAYWADPIRCIRHESTSIAMEIKLT